MAYTADNFEVKGLGLFLGDGSMEPDAGAKKEECKAMPYCLTEVEECLFFGRGVVKKVYHLIQPSFQVVLIRRWNHWYAPDKDNGGL